MLDDYAAVLSRDDVHVLERDGRIIGVLVLKRRDGGMLLDNIAVHPACQGEGLGDRLLAFAQARVTGMGFTHLELHTHALMHRKFAWYERHVFMVCARVHEHGFDRVYMRKRLAGTEPGA